MQVFASASKEDSKIVKSIVANLKQAGIKVWFDKTDLLPGQHWITALNEAISESFAVLFFISASTERTGTFQKELSLALAKSQEESEKFIIPILLGEVNRLPFFLQDLHSINLKNPSDPVEVKLTSSKILETLQQFDQSIFIHGDNNTVKYLETKREMILEGRKNLSAERKESTELSRAYLSMFYIFFILTAFAAIVLGIAYFVLADNVFDKNIKSQGLYTLFMLALGGFTYYLISYKTRKDILRNKNSNKYKS
ncbi:MAG: toll/interleukin-1 receptor domain-containing protein [Calditrichia bacterium]